MALVLEPLAQTELVLGSTEKAGDLVMSASIHFFFPPLFVSLFSSSCLYLQTPKHPLPRHYSSSPNHILGRLRPHPVSRASPATGTVELSFFGPTSPKEAEKVKGSGKCRAEPLLGAARTMQV